MTDNIFFFKDLEKVASYVPEPDSSFQSLAVGQKFWLEVEVKNAQLAMYLFKWLNDTNDDKKHWELLGCSLNTIFTGKPVSSNILDDIQHVLDKYSQEPLDDYNKNRTYN